MPCLRRRLLPVQVPKRPRCPEHLVMALAEQTGQACHAVLHVVPIHDVLRVHDPAELLKLGS
jgi:hypothetical protein